MPPAEAGSGIKLTRYPALSAAADCVLGFPLPSRGAGLRRLIGVHYRNPNVLSQKAEPEWWKR
jgi:hypothetical protein